MKKSILVLILVLTLAGCGMSESTENSNFDKGMILFDQADNEYLVRHDLNESYSVKLVPKKNSSMSK